MTLVQSVIFIIFMSHHCDLSMSSSFKIPISASLWLGYTVHFYEHSK